MPSGHYRRDNNTLRKLALETRLEKRKDGSFEIFAETPSGRRIWVIWRYDRDDDQVPDVFGELGEVPIFVITAY